MIVNLNTIYYKNDKRISIYMPIKINNREKLSHL